MRHLLRLAPIVIAAALAASCGVPTEDTPRPFPQAANTAATPTPAAAASGSVTERLYLVKDDQLVRADRKLPAVPPPEQVLRDLLTGPTDRESANGLSSALSGTNAAATLTVQPDGTAVVDITNGLDATGRNDEFLAYGQIVCTLTSLPGISRVTFTRQGQPSIVPRGDLSLTQEPVGTADYANLLAAK